MIEELLNKELHQLNTYKWVVIAIILSAVFFCTGFISYAWADNMYTEVIEAAKCR